MTSTFLDGSYVSSQYVLINDVYGHQNNVTTVNPRDVCFFEAIILPAGIGRRASSLELVMDGGLMNIAEIQVFGQETLTEPIYDPWNARRVAKTDCVCADGSTNLPCKSCVHGHFQNGSCTCDKCFSGEQCDTMKNECMCINGAYVGNSCVCSPGFTGTTCDETTAVTDEPKELCTHVWPVCKVLCTSCSEKDKQPVDRNNLHYCPWNWPFNLFCATDPSALNTCRFVFPYGYLCVDNDTVDDIDSVDHNFGYTNIGK